MQRHIEQIDDARRRRPWGLAAAIITVVAVTVLIAVPLVGAATETPAGNETELDVVFVFDNSQSTDENRYHMAEEIGRLAAAFDGTGIDPRYGLVTYNGSVRVEQPLTTDFDAFDRAMHFPAGGSVENASEAILAVEDLETRANAETVVVLVTDEDDDSPEATRDAAVASLSGVHFVAVSPPDAAESSCAVHSPPCDNRTDNELRTVAEGVNGTWIDVDAPAGTVVDRIGDAIAEEFETQAVEPAPRATFELVDAAANRTTATVGQPVGVTAMVRNNGTAEGNYHAYLSHQGRIFDETNVTVPANTSRTVTLAATFQRPGTYELLVTHEPAVTVEVIAGTDQSVETTTDGGTIDTTDGKRDTVETDAMDENQGTDEEPTDARQNVTAGSFPTIQLLLGAMVIGGLSLAAYRRAG